MAGKVTTICVNSCTRNEQLRRQADQNARSPSFPRTPAQQRDFSTREDFKVGKVYLETIPAMQFDQGVCGWNPGQGTVTVYDPSAEPTGDVEGGCYNPRRPNRSAYEVYNFTCRPLKVGEHVYLHREFKGGQWVAMPMELPGHIRIRVIEEIDPPAKRQCSPVKPEAQSAPIGTKQSRFSWMNYSSALPSMALLPDPDSLIDASDRRQLLFLYSSAGGGAPLPPTTTSACVEGDLSGIVGQCVFWYDDEGTLVGQVTILTAVYDSQADDTCLTWEPALPEPPGAGWQMRVPAAKCAGPYEVQLLGYAEDADCGDVCGLADCETTIEVYTDLPCTLEADTEWEAVLFSGCDGCGRYFIRDTREPFIHGIATQAIAPFYTSGEPPNTVGTWCSGLIDVYELGDVTVDAIDACKEARREHKVLEDDCSTTTQIRVYNGCPFEVNVGDRVQAHLKGCNYLITSVCCPED